MAQEIVRELVAGVWRTVRRQQAGGGGSLPQSESATGSGATNIEDGASADLPLAHLGGDALLDYTNPATPTVLADGIYAVTTVGVCNSGPQTNTWRFQALLDGSVLATQITNNTPAGAPGGAEMGATVIGPLSAGDAIRCTAFNDTGDGPFNFSVTAFVVVKLA